MKTLQIRIDFESDWSCGTGTGVHKGVDSRIVRDRNGLPYVSGKTLRGMLRDACELAAVALSGNNAKSTWHTLVKELFTTHNRDNQLIVTGAHLSNTWAQQLGEIPHQTPTKIDEKNQQTRHLRAAQREALVIHRTHVAIDPTTGTATPDALRTLEFARSGLSLHGRIEADNISDSTELLLRAGAKLIHHIGGNRRRGGGRCTITWNQETDNGTHRMTELVNKLGNENGFKEPPVTPAPTKKTNSQLGETPSYTAIQETPRRPFVPAAELTFETHTPLLVSTTVRGNITHSAPQIYASTLLPFITHRIGNRAQQLIATGAIIVTDANLVVNGQRAVPTPHCFVSGKAADHWQNTGTAVNHFNPRTSPVWKPVGGWSPPLLAKDHTIHRGTVQFVTSAHAVISDEEQRPTDEGLYTYISIAPGTQLRAEIWHDGSLTAEEISALQQINNTTHRLGRATTSGFGEVTVTAQPAPTHTPPEGPVTDLVLCLESLTVLPGPFGEPQTSPQALLAAIQKAIGPEHTLKLESSMVRADRRESWVRASDTPRPSLTGLAAGSSIRITCTPAISPAVLNTALSAGIGAHTVEGAGRIRTLPAHCLDHLKVQPATNTPTTPKQQHRDPVSDRTLGTITSSAMRTALDQAVLHLASDAKARAKYIPPHATRSQLGTLRRALELWGTQHNALTLWARSVTTRQESAITWESVLGQIQTLALGTGKAFDNAFNDLLTTLNTFQKRTGAVQLSTGTEGLDPKTIVVTTYLACLKATTVTHQATQKEG